MTNYTVVFSHPSGATATFIYENGELSALAKGLDAEQFWTFKQVKALLLRNEEDDLHLASDMMAKLGFTTEVMRPLPDLLAPVTATPSISGNPEEEEITMRYRTLPDPYGGLVPAHIVDEIHWREHYRESPPSPHRAPAVPIPESARPATGAVKPWTPGATPARTVDEIHWREGDQHGH